MKRPHRKPRSLFTPPVPKVSGFMLDNHLAPELEWFDVELANEGSKWMKKVIDVVYLRTEVV
jgi:hypothetical protein